MRIKIKTLSIMCAEPEGKVAGPDEAHAAARAAYAKLSLDPRQEHFLVLMLDVRGRIAGARCVSTGTMTASLVHPREVFRPAVEESAVQIILVHNHPSGDPSPSGEDIRLTERLRDAGRILGIPVVDHIILGRGETYRAIGGEP